MERSGSEDEQEADEFVIVEAEAIDSCELLSGSDSALDSSNDEDYELRMAKLQSENLHLKRQLAKKELELRTEQHNFLTLSQVTEEEIAQLKRQLERSESERQRLEQENEELAGELAAERLERRQLQLVSAGRLT